MSALPSRSTGAEPQPADSSSADRAAGVASPQPLRGRPESPSGIATTVPAPVRELTLRALLIGLAMGAVLAAGNVYTGLKSGFIDGGALTAALLSFTFFATFKRLTRRNPFGPLENNIAQTAAAAAALMAFVHGLQGPIPALMLLGRAPPPWAIWSWGLALGVIGLVMGALLRRRLIVEDALPFPTGTATAELIKAVHTDHGAAARRTRFLIVAAVLAAAVTWFRDGRPSLIPQGFYLPLTIGGLTAASLSLGIGTSPLMAATGMFIGLRSAFGLFLGGVIGWAMIAPFAVRSGWTRDGNYGTLASWLVWPALGLMMASTLVPVLLEWRKGAQVLLRTLRDARNLIGNRAGGSDGEHAASATHELSDPSRRRSAVNRPLVVAIVVFAAAAMSWTGWRAFGFSPVLTCAALLLSVVFSAVCARAAGETDIAPVGSFGTLTQILFAGGGPGSSIVAGSIASGSASQVAQAMWAFKAGHSLRASVRAQIIAQLLGAIVGSLVVVPIYLLVVHAYPLGTERMPAVSALSWKATSEALSGGLSGLAPHGADAAAIAFGVGALICVLARTRMAKFLPSTMALGIGMIMPVSLTAASLLGAVALLVARRRLPLLGDGEFNAVPAGLLAGESLLGVAIAGLAAAGILHFQ